MRTYLLRHAKRVAAGSVVAVGTSATVVAYSFNSSYEEPSAFAKSLTFADGRVFQPKPPVVLTPRQKEQFQKDGYLVLKDVIPAEFIGCLRAEADNYAKNYRGVQKWFTQFSGRSAIHGASQNAGWARALATRYVETFGVNSIAAQLLSSSCSSNSSPSAPSISPSLKLRLVLDTLDIIPFKSSSAKTAPFRKDKNNHTPGLRVWIPMDDIDADTAPTVVVPGSHRWQTDCQTGHFEGGERMPMCPGFKELMENRSYWRPVVVDGMALGDVLFIDTRVLHGWAPNTSVAPHRLAMRLTIKPEAARFYQPIKFHDLGPMDLVAPQIYPLDASVQQRHANFESSGSWPVKEPPFSEFASFSLTMLQLAMRHKFAAQTNRFLPYGEITASPKPQNATSSAAADSSAQS
mmetsp:Transcript_29408/g.57706  ORF Transcript_29408/g.57706 Transcript_29408/m.57706 type:complete len:405 (+) Transcript_29408:81-1295(+)